MSVAPYQVWLSFGDGPQAGPRFNLLGDALLFVHAAGRDAACAVKMPDGSWYRDGRGRAVFGTAPAA